ncbi:MAG: GyrI-like domain-containing protein [Coprobacillus sp.]
MNKLDYKKVYKDLYMPSTQPMLIEVPMIQYVMVEGCGDPNTSLAYKQALELLYGLSYTIKMSKMNKLKPDNYFEYVVPPLEGFWYGKDCYFDGLNITDKNDFYWKSLIRLPEFVDENIFQQAKQSLALKKPELDVHKLQYVQIEEGLCVQIMHKGSYDEEVTSILKMNDYIKENHLICDIDDKNRFHHEIYLSDPRKAKPENLKTVIRHPVRRV